MQTLLLVSILVATVWIPLTAARIPDPRRAVRAVILRVLLFCAFYLFALRFIYPRL